MLSQGAAKTPSGSWKNLLAHWRGSRKGYFHHLAVGPRAASPWRKCLTECAFGVGSQLSGHAVCIVTALSSAAAGGVSTARGHDIWSGLFVGTTIYAASVAVRIFFTRDRHLPGIKAAALALVLGLIVSTTIDGGRVYSHHLELTNWYQQLSDADRRQVRGKVRRWMERQSVSQRASLEETAQVLGYDFAEDYVVINFCTPSNKELAAIWDDTRGAAPKP
jgi:hypothetical protein